MRTIPREFARYDVPDLGSLKRRSRREQMDDVLALAEFEQQFVGAVNRRIAKMGDPTATQASWRSATGMLTFNQLIQTGTSSATDHNLANFGPNAAFSGVAGTWQASTFWADSYEFFAWGTSDFAASATLNFWVKLGTTKAQTASIALPSTAATGKRWDVTAWVAVYGVGATGSLMIQIMGHHESLAAPFIFSSNLIASPTTTTNDTTLATPNSLTLGMNWSASSASNNCRCHITNVSKMSAAY